MKLILQEKLAFKFIQKLAIFCSIILPSLILSCISIATILLTFFKTSVGNQSNQLFHIKAFSKEQSITNKTVLKLKLSLQTFLNLIKLPMKVSGSCLIIQKQQTDTIYLSNKTTKTIQILLINLTAYFFFYFIINKTLQQN